MIALQDQAYHVHGLQKYFHIISSQCNRKTEGYKGTLIAHCRDEHDSYAELNLKEDTPVCQKTEPVDRFSIKYDPKNNPPNHGDIIPNQREKEVK